MRAMACPILHSIEVDGRAFAMPFPVRVCVGDLVPLDPSGERWAKAVGVVQPYREGGLVRVAALPSGPPPDPPERV